MKRNWMGVQMGVAVLAVAAALSAPRADAQCVKTLDGSGVGCHTLYAGQHINAGDVCVEVQGDQLAVTFTTTGGWEIVETHVWAGTVLANMPVTRKGSPVPGQFPQKSGDVTGATRHTAAIPLAALDPDCEQTVFLAAHAALRKARPDGGYQTETGWSAGKPIVDKGNWATVSEFVITCDCGSTGGGETVCETAWAKGATCFLDIPGLDAKRWGWTVGPLGEGSHSLPLYAGAAKCDIAKGALAGTVSVAYADGVAVVTFQTVAPFTMSVAQLHVGAEMLPRDKDDDFTVAPGQLGRNSGDITGATSHTFTVEGLSGAVYVAAHAEVCRVID